MTQQSLIASCSSQLRRSATLLGGLVPVVRLLALTAWNVTRSAALAQARQTYARGELVPCLGRALDHLQRRPWSREAALLAVRCLSRLDYSDAAEPYYHRAGELDLNDLQTRAYGLARGNHRQRAIEAYKQILAHWPDNVTALRRLAAVELSAPYSQFAVRLRWRVVFSILGSSVLKCEAWDFSPFSRSRSSC